MVFSSATFLFIFLPIFLFIILTLKDKPITNILLLIISLIFYAWGEPVYVLLMIGSVAVNWLIALPAIWLADNKYSVTRRVISWSAVCFNVCLLGLFKYSAFIAETLNWLFKARIPVPQIPLPIGISFFTFQAMSYVIDAYKGNIRVQKNYFKLLLYVSFFPQLIAGPIVRYADIEKQLDHREITYERIANGLRRFIIGLSKKLIIANCVGQIVDTVYSCPKETLNLPLAWLAAVCYCLQIYFDFSGYSDMAIGLGGIAGFDFKENFNYPYTAVSIKDFWDKWHISLSTWLKEYVYFPLGGSRKGKIRAGLNLMLVFLISGVWHGAQWTFVVWGIIHGFFRLLEYYKVIQPEKWFKPIRHLYTLFVVCIAFVVFRADNLSVAVTMLKTMFAGPLSTPVGDIRLAGLFSSYNIFIILAALIASMPVKKVLIGRFENDPPIYSALDLSGYALSVFMAVLCILAISNASYNPFIYFRF